VDYEHAAYDSGSLSDDCTITLNCVGAAQMSLKDINSLASDIFDECTEDEERGGWAPNEDYGTFLFSELLMRSGPLMVSRAEPELVGYYH